MTNPLAPRVRLLSTGGPTVLIELGGLRLLTDPTFDAPRDYVSGSGAKLTKTEPAALGPEELGRIDAVLLSHDQHSDNLDGSGRALLARMPRVLTTAVGAARLAERGDCAHAEGLEPWDTREFARPDGGSLTVTAVPALHGPEGFELSGPVIGFVLSAPDLPTVYVSGDNASLRLVEQIARRCGPVETAVIFAGAACVPDFYGPDVQLTLDSAQAAEAARLLGARRAVVLHCDSWAHFAEDFGTVEKAFASAGLGETLSHTRHGSAYEL